MNTTKSSVTAARVVKRALLVGVAIASTACGWSNKSRGAAIGTTSGAAVGGVVGSKTGSTARGAIIGAVVGGATGMIIGSRMDQQAKDLMAAIPGATVERVGEGLVVTFDSGLLYDFDSDRVRADAGVNLRNLATSLNEYPATDLLIVGHTDAVGTSAYNEDLSTRRATSAARYLAEQQVASSRIRTSGVGEAEPAASNATEAGRRTNRRIEVAIFATAAARGAPR